ncbi:hypothetical protein BH10CYA1_BH10CYA1_18030 [soil metagenome]
MTNQTSSSPLLVLDKRGTLLFVLSNGQQVPLKFSTLPTRDGVAREAIRIGGGTKGQSPAEIAKAIEMYVDAFRTVDAEGKTVRPFRGFVWSGGTINLDDAGAFKQDMVTVIPSIISRNYPCLSGGSTPKTADLALSPEGRLIVDMYGTTIDTGMHVELIVQPDAANVLDWDGDLPMYLTQMEGWKDIGVKVAEIVRNGGAITRKEIYESLRRGIPVLLERGSGRETDAFIAAFESGDWTLTAAEERAKALKIDDAEARKAKIEEVDAIVAECKDTLARSDRGLISIFGTAVELRAALLARGFLN